MKHTMDDTTGFEYDDAPPVKEYQQREIFAYGRYIQCQILNWDEGPPPLCLVCHPLDRDLHEQFIAMQGLGTWMRIELVDVLMRITADNVRLRAALADIAKMHKGDQPAAMNVSDLQWADRHIMSMRIAARKAIA